MKVSRCLASVVLAVAIPLALPAAIEETAFYRMRANGATTITSLDRHGVLSWVCQDAETAVCTICPQQAKGALDAARPGLD